jgi:hypothetical protein
MIVFVKDNIKVAFKLYIPKKDLDDYFKAAIKRTFDLSIAPDGQIYENWHQQAGVVERKLSRYSK